MKTQPGWQEWYSDACHALQVLVAQPLEAESPVPWMTMEEVVIETINDILNLHPVGQAYLNRPYGDMLADEADYQLTPWHESHPEAYEAWDE